MSFIYGKIFQSKYFEGSFFVILIIFFSVFSAELEPQNIIMGIEALKQIYGDVQCQVFSPCQNFLVAGNIYGDIFVFDLRISLSPAESESERIREAERRFQLPVGNAACSAASTEKFLLIGGVGHVFGYEWRFVISKSTKHPPKLAFSWDLLPRKEEVENVEVNAVLVSNDGRDVMVAGGDKQVHVFSLEDGRLVRSLAGHTDYIHDLALVDENGVGSASEDGTVRIWDQRAALARTILTPYKETALQRPKLGQWVGSLHVDKEWMVCGGGVMAGLWHLPSQSLTTAFPTDPETPCHALLMHQEHVLVGDRYKVRRFNLVGDGVSSVACSSNTVLSIKYLQTEQHTVLSLSGTSRFLDICKNMMCRDQIFSCS